MKVSFRLNLCFLGLSCQRLALHAIRHALRERHRPSIYAREIAHAKSEASHARQWLNQWAACTR